jgi:hypothetical protein
MMDLRYVYNGQPVAEGERAMIYQGGRLYVRTGVKGFDPVTGEIIYRTREVYDAAKPIQNIPPAGGNVSLTFEVPAP